MDKSRYIFMFLLVFITSCSTTNINNTSTCNFSSNFSEPERCFGGVGDRCKGITLIAPMVYNYKQCTIKGSMSIGSIEHDKCCIKTGNKGYKCAFSTKHTKVCKKEWDKAVKDALCNRFGAARQWKEIFGPYPRLNTGDSTSKLFYAPKKTKVSPHYQKYCKNGCVKDKAGFVQYHRDLCGLYCTCK